MPSSIEHEVANPKIAQGEAWDSMGAVGIAADDAHGPAACWRVARWPTSAAERSPLHGTTVAIALAPFGLLTPLLG